MPSAKTLPAPSDKTGALAALHAEILQCQRCELWRTRTQAVPGVGPADARIMLVGEAPGRQEDLKGEPFVGSAGRFLDGLLASVGLSREQVYITNVVKSRPFIWPPPGRNRAPTSGEITACRAWLDDQLRIIRPRIVVAMGRVALEYFLPGKKISQVHGRPLRQDGRVFLPVFHPAVAYHRQDLRDTLKHDFLKLRALVRTRPVGSGSTARPKRKERPGQAQNTRG